MNEITASPKKALAKIGLDGDMINALRNIFPLFAELDNKEIKFHFLFLKDEQDHLSLRLNEGDKAVVQDLFADLYDIDIQDSWEAYHFNEQRFGNTKMQFLVDHFLESSNAILLRTLQDKLQDYDYGNVLSDAVFFFYHFANAICKDKRILEEFHLMYFEQWQNYLPKGIGKKEITNSWREEIGILRSIVEKEAMDPSAASEQNYFQQLAKLGRDLKQQLEILITEKEFTARDQKYKYPIKIESIEFQQSKFEILADVMHFFLNAFGIQNEDEALISFLSQSMFFQDDENVRGKDQPNVTWSSRGQ